MSARFNQLVFRLPFTYSLQNIVVVWVCYPTMFGYCLLNIEYLLFTMSCMSRLASSPAVLRTMHVYVFESTVESS